MKRILLSFILLSFLGANGQEIVHQHHSKMAFIENKGQWDSEILFKSQFNGGNLWVQQHKFLFHLLDFTNIKKNHANPNERPDLSYKQSVLHLNFVGSNEVKEIEKNEIYPHYFNFFIGNDPTKWKGNVQCMSEASLKNFYNGIDLKLIESNSQLKYEFHVKPNVNPGQIKLKFAGHEKMRISKQGNLIIETELGIVEEQKPYVYQIKNGKITEIACSFELNGDEVQFKLGKYDTNFTLIIDPILVFATYCGSVTDNFGMTATYGQDGSAFSAGTVYGNAYPTPDDLAYDINSNFTVQNVGGSITTDAFISKYAADGSTMIWTTFIGGGDDTQGTETAHSLICDKQDNLYIYGVTSSVDFPIQGGFQNTHGGGQNLVVAFNGSNFGTQGTDIFVAKISANGHQLLASTYIGGSNNDGVNYSEFGRLGNYSGVQFYDSLTTNYGDQFRGEIMLDSLNNVLIASCTRSTNFPTQSPFQASNAGMQDGVIFKLNTSLSGLIFSSYFGGSNNDACYSVKIDSSYQIVFSGGTSSTNLPMTVGSYQATYGGGIADGFVGKLIPTGLSLQKVSYLGMANYDQAFFVEIDRNNSVFVLGQSRGGNFPVVNASFSVPNSSQFIIKLDETLTSVQNSTVFGNGNTDINISPSAFLVDICGNMYVSGWGANILQGTPLNGMPVSTDAFLSNPANGFDFYLMVVERSFNSLKYGSYLGGNLAQEHVDGGTSRFDKNGVVYQSVCGGCGGHSDFPTTPGAWSNQNLSFNCNNLIFKFDFELILNAAFTPSTLEGCAPMSVTFDNTSSSSDSYLWDFGNGDTTSIIFSPTKTYNTPGLYTIRLITLDSICLLSDTAEITINVGPDLSYTITNDTLLCAQEFIDLVVETNGIANQFIWSSSINFSDTLNPNLNDSVFSVLPQNLDQTYYVQFSNGGCIKMDSVRVQSTGAGLQLQGSNQVCSNEPYTVTAINTSGLVYTHSWRPNALIQSQPQPNQVVCSAASPSYVYVDVNASNGCTFTDSILIDVSLVNPIMVDAQASETVVLTGSTVQLQAVPIGNYTYSWTPITGLNQPNQSTTNATVNNTSTYVVTVSDGQCSATDSITIICVTAECKPPAIFVPNAFSPNNKNKNEVLYVRGPQITEMLFRVYSRWGELVFESRDPQIGWDGTFKGRTLDPDVFDYYLEVTCVGGNSEIIKGNIQILK